MCSGELVYTGAARILLEGNDALFAGDAPYARSMRYHVGADLSPLTIIDHRARPVWAAQRVLSGANSVDFAAEFNRDAWVQIRECPDCVEIELDESPQNGELPILCLGVLDGDVIPIQKVVWDALFAIENDRTAFAAVADAVEAGSSG